MIEYCATCGDKVTTTDGRCPVCRGKKLSCVPPKSSLVQGTRPCTVNGRKATFHTWEHKAWVVAPGISIGSHPGGQIAITFGIVEYEDGTVHEVYPSEIIFIDKE